MLVSMVWVSICYLHLRPIVYYKWLYYEFIIKHRYQCYSYYHKSFSDMYVWVTRLCVLFNQNVYIHTADSTSVIIGVVTGITCISVILTLIVIMSVTCFFKTHRQKMATLGNVLLICAV